MKKHSICNCRNIFTIHTIRFVSVFIITFSTKTEWCWWVYNVFKWQVWMAELTYTVHTHRHMNQLICSTIFFFCNTRVEKHKKLLINVLKTDFYCKFRQTFDRFFEFSFIFIGKRCFLSERRCWDGSDDCPRMARKISAQENTIQVRIPSTKHFWRESILPMVSCIIL